QGLPTVRAEVERVGAAAGPRPVDGPMRLPLDRVFAVKGFGTVVTGTLATGRAHEGDDVTALPGAASGAGAAGGRVGRIRGIEVRGDKRAEAAAGERTAANLQGLERDELQRGMVLVRAGE